MKRLKKVIDKVVKPLTLAVLMTAVSVGFLGCGTAAGIFTPTTAIHTVLETNTYTVTNTVVVTNQVTLTNSVGVVHEVPIYVTNVQTKIETAVVTNIVNVTNG